jgi:hypothetical protein
MQNTPFNANKWLDKARHDLIQEIILREFNITDISNPKNHDCIRYHDLIKPEIVARFKTLYSPAIKAIFSDDTTQGPGKLFFVRSTLPYYEKEPRLVLNILRQSLFHIGYQLKSNRLRIGRLPLTNSPVYDVRYFIKSLSEPEPEPEPKPEPLPKIQHKGRPVKYKVKTKPVSPPHFTCRPGTLKFGSSSQMPLSAIILSTH